VLRRLLGRLGNEAARHNRRESYWKSAWEERKKGGAVLKRKRVKLEWRLDKAQQNGALLRKWPQRLAGGSRKPGSISCQPRFPRVGWVSTEAKKNQEDQAAYGHPEATLAQGMQKVE
jgi:hypothetical protein